MIPALAWLWILSGAGALAFFAAGALLAARRASHAHAMAPPLARALSEVAALDDDRRRLGDEVTRLTHELGEARRRQRAPTDEVTTQTEVDATRLRLAEAEELKEENARLRAQVARARELATRAAALEGELAKARRALQAAPAAPPVRAVARQTARLSTSPALGTLDAIIAELRADPRIAAAVISDELGLLVAGGGEGAETMAALGGYLAGVGARAQGLLKLDAMSRIIVEDDHGKVLTATRLAGAPLVAVTVSKAHA
jgi:predicted regulator of Ras-like GTPase activity (Roadblock/LC7/MglB family)